MDREELESSLRPFSDPATEFKLSPGDASAKIAMVRDGEERTYMADLDTGIIEKRSPTKARFANLDSLLASAEFANLRFMADTQRRILRERGEKPFLPPHLSLDDQDTELPAFEATLSPSKAGPLRIVLLDGPAGVGKTYLIERLAWQRADAYVSGGASPPMLHVTSRGRRLSNLKDALSTEIADVRGKFTFGQVPVLVRRNLLALAIDGFDELVDAEGYHDAWFALRSFLDDIGAGGLCILAGRDTFFDQQDFRQRLQRENKSTGFSLARLLPVGPSAAKEWLAMRGWPEAQINHPFADEVLRPGSYTLRPYFLKELAELRSWDALPRTARGFLIDRFLDREAKLIHNVVIINEESARAALVQFFEDIALNMSEEETDVIDLPFLALLCELAFEAVLDPNNLKKLKHKVGSTGLLESDPRLSSQRRFPHSEIQHHFLAHGLLRMLTKDQVTRILRRAVLGADFLEVFQDVCEEVGVERVGPFTEFIRGLLQQEMSMDRMAQNGGALLVVATAGGFAGQDVIIEDLALSELVLAGTVAAMKLRRVNVGQLKAQGADLSQLVFEECHVHTLVVDETTRFGASTPEVTVVHEFSGQRTTLRAPLEVREWLHRHSMQAPAEQTLQTLTEQTSEAASDALLPLVRLFERVCRKALRQFYIRDGDEDAAGAMLKHPLWPELLKILTEAGRVEHSDRPKSGPAAYLIHIKNPRALLEPPPGDDASRRVRQAVLARARQHA